MATGYQRILTHYAADASTVIGEISLDAVEGCWFELHRQGGCGAGEFHLKSDFLARHAIDVGDWIACDYAPGDRWYFGRVESREASSPAGIRFRLEGMGIELGEVFPGGFGSSADGVPPHRYANTDLFPHDPDYLLETFDSVATIGQLVNGLLSHYVTSATHIAHDPLDVEEPPDGGSLASFKFRGEESVRSILKDLSLRARGASWGVDEQGEFFFRQQKTTLQAIWREGLDVSRLEESRDRELLYNRVMLTGGYVYDEPVNSENTARGFYRWRATYFQPESRNVHGERRIRLWVPWIRTATDSRTFVREFFRTYAQPISKFLVEIPNRTTLIKPWEGPVRLLDRNGAELTVSQIATLRVLFDHAPRFRLELGPLDPHTLWPEPPHDERWEISRARQEGGSVSVTSDLPPSSDSSEELTSSLASSGSLSFSSTISSGVSTSGSLSVSDHTSDSIDSSGESSDLTSSEFESGTSLSGSSFESSPGSEGQTSDSGASGSGPGSSQPSGSESGPISSSLAVSSSAGGVSSSVEPSSVE
jgi:hypothetical protein